MTQKNEGSAGILRIMAERLLTERFGCSVRLGKGRNVAGRANVYRFDVVEGPQELAKGIIVKCAHHPEHFERRASGYPDSAWLLFNDWAGLQFVNQVAHNLSLCPHFYTGDQDKGIVILEEVQTDTRLDMLLLGSDAHAAEEALVQLATTLGQLHACTMGKQAEFDGIRDSLAPRVQTWGWVPPWSRGEAQFSRLLDAQDTENGERDFQSYQWMTSVLHKVTASLDVPVPQQVERELATVMAAMRDPGPFLAYTHGDPCPDNCLPSHGNVRLVDFEIAGFRHALTDAVYGRMSFPTCWCVNRTAKRIVQRMELTYRTELIKGCPQAVDDRLFAQALVEACAYWVLMLCQFDTISALLEEDGEWGIATMRQRVVTRFESFAQATEEFGYLEAMGAVFHGMAVKLCSLWSVQEDTTPVYPAFR